MGFGKNGIFSKAKWIVKCVFTKIKAKTIMAALKILSQMALLALNIWTDMDFIDCKGILIYKLSLCSWVRKKIITYAGIFFNVVETKKKKLCSEVDNVHKDLTMKYWFHKPQSIKTNK